MLSAVPGCNPPSSPNYDSIVHAPFDGSLILNVWEGPETDDVYYAFVFPGPNEMRRILISPDYPFIDKLAASRNIKPDGSYMAINPTEPYLMTFNLSPNGDEITGHLVDKDTNYLHKKQLGPDLWVWTIILPPNIVPIGLTKLSICGNGHIFTKYIERPYTFKDTPECLDRTPKIGANLYGD